MNEVERCRPWIEAALQHSGGSHSFEDIQAGIASGVMQLWPAPKGCAVTEIVQFPQKRVLHIFLAGGEMAQLFDMIESAAAWGKVQGCAAITVAGREGWKRALKGWAFHSVTMERAI